MRFQGKLTKWNAERGMFALDYVLAAVRKKNDRAVKDRMVFLSRQLSVQHLAENLSMDGSLGDGFCQSQVRGQPLASLGS